MFVITEFHCKRNILRQNCFEIILQKLTKRTFWGQKQTFFTSKHGIFWLLYFYEIQNVFYSLHFAYSEYISSKLLQKIYEILVWTQIPTRKFDYKFWIHKLVNYCELILCKYCSTTALCKHVGEIDPGVYPA